MPEKQRLADLLPLVDEVVQYIAWRHHLSADEAEDFGSTVRLRLLEDGERMLRGFGGRSDLKTYLVTVVSRQLFAFRESLWGKWRPSTTATRLGPTAVLLEELVVRNGLPFDEAVELMQATHRVPLTRESIHDLLTELPVRTPRLTVSDEALANTPAGGSAPDEGLALAEHEARLGRVEAALARALARLSAQERLMMALRFVDDLTPPQIARALGLEVRPLYRRLGKVTQTVKDAMLADGITPEDVASVLGHPVAVVDRMLRRKRWGTAQPRPAN